MFNLRVAVLLFPFMPCAEEASLKALRGMDRIEVVIEDFSAAGLTKEQIQTDVELKLRKAGMRVFRESDNLLVPMLYINIDLFSQKGVPVYAFSLAVEFHRFMTLPRDIYYDDVRPLEAKSKRTETSICIPLPEFSTFALNLPSEAGDVQVPVWRKETLGLIGTTNIAKLRPAVSDFVDSFINDWLAANETATGPKAILK